MVTIKMLLNYLLNRCKTKKKNITISYYCFIDSKILENIGDFSKIGYGVSCFGNVQIGRYTSINGPSTQIGAKINRIQIGNFCSIASGVVIQEYYHRYNRPTTYFINRNVFKKDIFYDIYSKGDIIIEDDVWIGANSVILSGITVGRGSIIGAGSVVTKNVPRYSIMAGNPAKIIKKRFSKEDMVYLENTLWWDWSDQTIHENLDFFNQIISNSDHSDESIEN
jgi:acetyltransferase-like isoleucine patch superfamily enzyme